MNSTKIFDRIFVLGFFPFPLNQGEGDVTGRQLTNESRMLDAFYDIEGKISRSYENISQKGMRFRSSRYFKEMTVLDIMLQLPSNTDNGAPPTKVECGGVVVSCEKKWPDSIEQPYEVSIFFHRISSRNRKILEDFIAS